MRFAFFIFVTLFSLQAVSAQPNKGIIKVRKAKNVQGLFVLEEGAYYKEKLYVRFFENNEAIFLRAAVDAEKAKDSCARLLYTYRKSACSYKIVNDSVIVSGAEGKIPFTYRGVFKNGVINARKVTQDKVTRVSFKKLL
ncbi:MAG TPA: hypothetical protein VK177_20550 [Flavobacteriales bacterium]|nr:hypothetical protein [Flavobacteriales bacterium]